MGSPNPELRLQYTFDDQTQLIRHAHSLEGERFALFYPIRNLNAEAHARVLLHIVFADTGQSLVLFGKLMSRTMGSAIEGVWLEFSEKRLLQIVTSRLVVARNSRRYAMDALVRLSDGSRASALARMVDISSHGARVSNFARGVVGQLFNLSLMQPRPDVPTQLGQARVVRAADSGLGLQFFSDDPLSRRAMLRLVTCVEKEWASVQNLAHPALCCRGGVVLQPNLPRVREPVTARHLG